MITFTLENVSWMNCTTVTDSSIVDFLTQTAEFRVLFSENHKQSSVLSVDDPEWQIFN